MGHSPWKRQRLARGRRIRERVKNKSLAPSIQKLMAHPTGLVSGKALCQLQLWLEMMTWAEEPQRHFCSVLWPLLDCLGLLKMPSISSLVTFLFLVDDCLSPQTGTFQWEKSQRIWSSESGNESSVMVSTFLDSTPVHKSIYMASFLHNRSQGTQLQEKTVTRGNDLTVCFQPLQK